MVKKKKLRGKETKARSPAVELISQSLRSQHLSCVILRSSALPSNAFNVNFALRLPHLRSYFFHSQQQPLATTVIWDKLNLEVLAKVRVPFIQIVVFYQVDDGPYRVLLEYGIQLSSMFFVSDNLDQTLSLVKTSKKLNTLILCCKGLFFSVHPASCGESGYAFDAPAINSCNYTSFQRLIRSSKAIMQAYARRNQLASRVQDKTESTQTPYHRVEELQCLINLRRSQLNRQKALLALAEEKLAALKTCNLSSTKQLENTKTVVVATEDEIKRIFSSCRMERINLETCNENLQKRRQILFKDLVRIFEVGNELLLDLPLPNSKKLEGRLTSSEEVLLSASYGYTALIIEIICALLCCPIRHSITFCGSKSKIRDEIIQEFNDPNFPLYPKGKERSYFLRAVFLLNLNIYGLWCNVGLMTYKPPNLRETSANLQELLDFLCGTPSSNVILVGKSADSVDPSMDISPARFLDNLSDLSEELPDDRTGIDFTEDSSVGRSTPD